MPNEGGNIAGSILGLVGGYFLGKKQHENAVEYESQKNARELLEKTVIGPAVANGEPDVLKVHEKTLRQHYTKGQLDLIGAMAEKNSLENNLKKSLSTINTLSGGVQPVQAAPATPAQQPGAISPSNASAGAPDVLQAMTSPQGATAPQQIAGPAQPSSDPRERVISDQRNQISSQQKYIQGLEGKLGIAPSATPPTTAVAQPRPAITPPTATINSTVGATGKITSTNVTPKTEQERAAFIAGANEKMGWLDKNPQVEKKFPELRQAIAAGNADANKLVEHLQLNGEVNPDELLKIEGSGLNWRDRNAQIRQLMGVERGNKYLAETAPEGAMLTKDVDARIRTETARLMLQKEGHANYATDTIVKQAQKNVLTNEIDEAQKKSTIVQNRMETVGALRANAQIASRTAMNLTKDVSANSDAISKGRYLLKALADIADVTIYAKKGAGVTPTGIAAIDNPIKEAMAKYQAGDKGPLLAVANGLAADLSVVEQRFFGGGSRIVEGLRNAMAPAIPNPTRQNAATFGSALVRSAQMMNEGERLAKKKVAGAASMLRASPFTKDIADAFEKGHYDATTQYLEQLNQKASGPDFMPVIPSDNNWAPVGQ